MESWNNEKMQRSGGRDQRSEVGGQGYVNSEMIWEKERPVQMMVTFSFVIKILFQ